MQGYTLELEGCWLEQNIGLLWWDLVVLGTAVKGLLKRLIQKWESQMCSELTKSDTREVRQPRKCQNIQILLLRFYSFP